MDRGAWWTTVHGVAKESDTTWRLNNHYDILMFSLGFPGVSDGKASAYYAGDLGLIPGLGRSPGAL